MNVSSFKMNILYLCSFLFLTISVSQAQIVDVEIGTNNVSITEIELIHDNVTITQTAGVTSNTPTDKSALLNHIEVNGTTKLYPNTSGNVVRNNNFASNVSGVGIYDNGNFIPANTASTFEPSLEETVNNIDLMQFLYYDATTNIPSGDDFDIYFAKGIVSGDYVSVGERNGNTYFTITPLDEMGTQIAGSSKVRFGFVATAGSGNGTTRYDWDIGYSPTNITNQSMVYTIVEADLFNIGSETIFGFRIDNNGEADVKFFGLNESGFDDHPTNPEIGGIAGNVFNDANGLSDATVNGTPISTPSNVQLYANLYDSTTGLIIASTPIKSDGSYEFLNLPAGSTYAVSVSTNQGIAGNAVPAQDLPTGWTYTGDNSDTSAGNDGAVDGIQNGLTVTTSMVYDVNYGIEEIPTADPYSFVIEDPAPNSAFGIGSGLTADLSGDDSEDGVLGASNSFGITSLPTNGNELYYNGVLISTGQFGMNPPSPTNPFIIPNYDPSLLEIVFSGDPTQSTTSFDYISIDAAGAYSEPVTYSLVYTALPVEWLYFKATKRNDNSVLEFATATEIDNNHFLVQKSTNGRDFITLETIEGAGHSVEIIHYSTIDTRLENGYNYYRIVQVDYNGASNMTDIEVIEHTTDESVSVFPNPVHTSNPIINVSYQSTGKNEIVRMYNTMGVEVMQTNIIGNEGLNTQAINIQALTPGTYFLKVGDRNELSTFIVFE